VEIGKAKTGNVQGKVLYICSKVCHHLVMSGRIALRNSSMKESIKNPVLEPRGTRAEITTKHEGTF